MRVTCCELPTRLDPQSSQWADLASRFAREQSDLLLLNEMPFGAWLATAPTYEASAATTAVALHQAALATFSTLSARTVVSSRPIPAANALINEAFAWDQGQVRPLHRKHYFPAEPGFYESSWFAAPRSGFEVSDVGGVRVGVLLCTELMFNEHARAYGRAGAQLILCPRASGVSVSSWKTGLAMAAIVSGCYVASSNRAGEDGGQIFGGRGMVFAPGGEQIAETNAYDPIATVAIDLGRVRAAQAEWPCYVSELS